MRTMPAFAASAALLLSLAVAGCRVDTNRHGDNKNVDIATPFGSMHVKSSDAQTVSGTGLTPYPGAVPLKKPREKDGDDDGNAADVNLSFGDFKLGVHAVELQTPDPESKVLAFYRQDMKRYGTVIACRGSDSVGKPTRTDAGLACDSTSNNDKDDEVQLRTGSPLHQHIVGVQSQEGGTRIGLVALDLPSQAASHDAGAQE